MTGQFSAEDMLHSLYFTIILLGIQYSKTIAHGMCFQKLISMLAQVVNSLSIPILSIISNLDCANKKPQYSFLQLLFLFNSSNFLYQLFISLE